MGSPQNDEYQFAPVSRNRYVWGMTVEAIKQAIAELPEDERHSLAEWLNELDYDEWDRQMVKDFSPGGRGMAWVEKGQARNSRGQSPPHGGGLRWAPQSCVALSCVRATPSGCTSGTLPLFHLCSQPLTSSRRVSRS